ncbi:Rieske (2Fe-2S) protein, partial [Nonomuraea lactucae]|uniref:Rieske (2Fe-2S) protein n=1 Tax=Nonomuraea lactucae TaxID=2249762 RepID=UPI0013B45B6C
TTQSTTGAADSGAVQSGAPSGAPASGSSGGGALAKTSDIPVGGGKVFKKRKVVVTQPTAGDFKAFSALCPHQGCAVTGVADGLIDCVCHNSKFKIEDGSVTEGPAKESLREVGITVDGDRITLA